MPATVRTVLRLAPQFRSDELEAVTDQLSARLDRRLSRYDDAHVDMEISVKDRDTVQQQVTLEVWIAAKGRSRFVATATNPELLAAVRAAGESVQRQIDRFVTKRETARRG